MRGAPRWTEFGRFPVVVGTVGVAILVSLAWWSGRDVSFLMEDAHLRRGEAWRLLTSAFPHVNALHLLFNVYWIWVFGTLVESVFGHVKALAIFALLAVASGAGEYAILDGGVGLSGIGYGLFAMTWVLSRNDPRFADAMDSRTVGLFVVWFFVCIVTTIEGVMPVGNFAHGVGAVVGALFGAAVGQRSRMRPAAGIATLVLAAACVLGATIARPYVNRSSKKGMDEARLGYVALEANRDAEAVGWLTEATDLNPSNAGAWFNLGIAYQRRGSLKDATLAYEKAWLIDPANPSFREAHEQVR